MRERASESETESERASNTDEKEIKRAQKIQLASKRKSERARERASKRARDPHMAKYFFEATGRDGLEAGKSPLFVI